MQLLQQMLGVMRDGMFAGSRMTLRVQDSSSGEVSHLAPGILVNAAGLQAQEVADRLKGLPAQHVPKRHLARGCYFSLSGQWQGGLSLLSWLPTRLYRSSSSSCAIFLSACYTLSRQSLSSASASVHDLLCLRGCG